MRKTSIEIYNTFKKIGEAYRIGKIDVAHGLLVEIENRYPELYNNNSYKFALNAGGVKVEYGRIHRDKDVIKNALNLLDNFYTETELASFEYNIANAFMELDRLSNDFSEKIEYKYLALHWYRKAIKICENRADLYVNYGNCLDTCFMRNIEALEYYEKALNIDSGFAMASANKGQILIYYSKFFENHTAQLILNNGYYMIKEAIDNNSQNILDYGGNKAIDFFKNILKKNEKLVGDTRITSYKCKSFKTIPLDYKGIEGYLTFCTRNNLWLNIFEKEHQCYFSLRDHLLIPKLGIDSLDNRALSIIELFSSARWLLYYARYETHIALRKITRSSDDLSVRRGMIINSFIGAFSVLDIIGNYIYELKDGYSRKNQRRNNIYFWNFLNDMDEGNICKKYTPLLALCSLSKDFYSENEIKRIIKNKKFLEKCESSLGIFYSFRNLRNKIIHRGNKIDEEEIFEKSLQLLKIVKSAIFYFYQFIYFMNKKKIQRIEEETIKTPSPHTPTQKEHYLQ